MTAAEIKKQMEANSAAWHTASEAERKRLHEENKRLNSLLGTAASTYNAASGQWSAPAPTTPAPEAPVAPAPSGPPAGFTGSTSVTGGTAVDPEIQALINAMNANSQSWLTATPEEQARLHGENKNISEQISNYWGQDGQNITTYTPKYNSAAGTWTITPNVRSQAAPVTETSQATKPNLIGQDLGDMYGLTYDMDQIKEILDKATELEYIAKNEEFANTENKFYSQMSGTQSTALDTMRRAQAASIATGASKGLASANELSAILGLQQESSILAGDLANQRNELAAEEAAAYSQNTSTALSDSNAIKQAISQIDLTKYGYDTQGYIGELDYLAALEEILASKYAADKTLEGVKYNADANVAASGKSSSSAYSSNSGKTVTGSNGKQYTYNPEGDKEPEGYESIYKDNLKVGVPWAPPGTSGTTFTLQEDGQIMVNTGDSSGLLSAYEMDKLGNNDWDMDALTQDNYGSFQVAAKDYSKMQAADLRAYEEAYGELPPGWIIGAVPNRTSSRMRAWIPDELRYMPTDEKPTDINAVEGAVVRVGKSPNDSQNWVYSTVSGVWSNSYGQTKNAKEFKEHTEKHSYVEVIENTLPANTNVNYPKKVTNPKNKHNKAKK